MSDWTKLCAEAPVLSFRDIDVGIKKPLNAEGKADDRRNPPTYEDRQRWIDLATAEAIRPPSAWLHVQFEPRHPLPLVPCAGWIVRSSDDGMRDIYAVWWQDKMAPDIEKIAAFPWQNAQAWEL